MTTAKVGRPPKLTGEVATRIVQALEAGNYRRRAAQYAGVSLRTLQEWLRVGRENPTRRAFGACSATVDINTGEVAWAYPRGLTYGEFLHRCMEAEAKAETRAVVLLGTHMKKRWQACAWYLERKHPERWGRREVITAGLMPGVPTGARGKTIQPRAVKLTLEVVRQGAADPETDPSPEG